jgi:N-acetylglutamate synthase-like GNAT family acetyltransferase
MTLFVIETNRLVEMVFELINDAAVSGELRPRTPESICEAIRIGDGYPIVVDGIVVAYAECREGPEWHSIHSVVVNQQIRQLGYGRKVVKNRLEECRRRNNQKKVILVCSETLVDWYRKFGFEPWPKTEAPKSIRGGRSDQEWKESDRVFMVREPLY